MMLDKIQEYLKTTGNQIVEATEIKEGVLHTEVTLKVKDFSNTNKLEKSLLGLPFFVKCANHILVPAPENGTFRLIIPNQDIKSVKFDPTAITKPTRIFLGVDEGGDKLFLDLDKITHTLIAGATGSGKSMVIHSIIHSLLNRGSVDIRFLDPKKVESQMYLGAKEITIASTPVEISIQLKQIHKWMEDRYDLMAKRNIRDAMEQWVASKYTDVSLRPMVLIVDEVADLFSENKAAKNEILILSSKARAAGLRIFLATQRPDAKIIDGAIKANFTTRICLKTSSRIDSMVVLGFAGAENLRGNGHGLLNMPDGRLIPFKGAFLDSIRMARFSMPVEATEEVTYFTKDVKNFVDKRGKHVE
jgi:DNA segregation ATPase FtsK/SpoIIIE, S-DNA-T family